MERTTAEVWPGCAGTGLFSRVLMVSNMLALSWTKWPSRAHSKAWPRGRWHSLLVRNLCSQTTRSRPPCFFACRALSGWGQTKIVEDSLKELRDSETRDATNEKL
eukprot:1975520-Lingulodinium_polyedra.AAC.1